MNNELLSKEETLEEIDEMMEFLRKLTVIYQRDPASFPADLLQKAKELTSEFFKKIMEARVQAEELDAVDNEDPRMTNQESTTH